MTALIGAQDAVSAGRRVWIIYDVVDLSAAAMVGKAIEAAGARSLPVISPAASIDTGTRPAPHW